MITKPNRSEQRGFWNADAWHAASAEPMFSWVGHNNRYPRLTKFVAIAFLIMLGLLTLIGLGLGVFMVTATILAAYVYAGGMLRRVLMYWSIRRYGPWQDMPHEMREVLERPSDLAAPPTSFTPLPPGFKPLLAGSLQPQPEKKAPWYKTVALVLLAPFIPMLIMFPVIWVAENPITAAFLAALAVFGWIQFRRYGSRKPETGS